MVQYYILAIDCEATGLSKFTDQIVEVGLVIYVLDSCTHRLQFISQYRELVCPQLATMSTGATKVTGITMSMLQGQRTCGPVLCNMAEHISEHCSEDWERFLVTYNGHAFDIPLLVAELQRAHENPVQYFRKLKITRMFDMLLWSRENLDSTKLIRKANGRCSYRLGDVYQCICGHALEGAHGALADCTALVRLLEFEDYYPLHTELCTPTAGTNPMTLVRSILPQISNRPKRRRERTLLDFLSNKKSTPVAGT
jgi:DNA polymerase III epsilon subunit-like protein